MSHRSHRRLFVSLVALPVLLGTAALSAASPELTRPEAEAMRVALAALQDRAGAAAQPLPEGQTKVLEAVIMQVRGKSAQWRPGANGKFRAAKIDDVIRPGATIRTGLGSAVTLRVGHNATILVDRNTRLVLPQIVQVGQTLTTRAQLARGKADFKVDRVGLTNDFSVVTPSTTLAVRGTGFGVEYGGFDGTEVFAARTNEMRAVEIAYFLSRYSYFMSGAATSSDKHMNPALAALFLTFGPPRILSGLIEDEETPELLDDSFERNPFIAARKVDNAEQSVVDLPVCPAGLDPFNLNDFGPAECDQIAAFIAGNLFAIFADYDDRMMRSFGEEQGGRGFSNPGLDRVFFDVDAFLDDRRGDYTEDDLRQVLNEIEAYCRGRFEHPRDFRKCITNFEDALRESFPHGGQ